MKKRSQPPRHHAVRGGKPGHFIFRPWRKNWKTGEIEHAKDFGKKAFAIWVPDEPSTQEGKAD